MRDPLPRMFVGPARAAAVAGVAVLLAAVDSFAADPPASQPSEERIAMLVKRLGDEECKVREAATAELAQLGLPTKSALTAVLDHPDLEVRIRARRLLTSVMTEDLERRLKEFAADVDDVGKVDLPSWQRFKQEFGNKTEARRLFVAMQREESVLLSAAAQGPRSAAAAVTERYNTLQIKALSATSGNRRPMSLETTAALVFVASDPDVQLSDGAAGWLATMVRQNAFAQAVGAETHDGIPRRMLIRWIEHPSAAKAANVAEMNLSAAIQYNLPEGLTPALQIIALNKSQAFYKQKAILVVGKRGGKEHLSVLEPLLQDTTRCGVLGNARGNGANAPAEIQVRDVALAVMIHLSGQDPKDFGYDHILTNEQVLYQSQTVGFDDSAKRDAALKKWEEWSAAQKK